MEHKKTEEQLRHEIRREFSYSEDRDAEKIDKILELKKDRYAATQAKKKAQQELEALKKDPKRETSDPKGENIGGEKSTLSVKDSAVLLEHKVPTDDWDDIIEYVKFQRTKNPDYTIKDAINSSAVKAILAEKAEKRQSAKAVHRGKGRRGSDKISGQDLLDKASKTGEIPESDEELDAMLEARYS